MIESKLLVIGKQGKTCCSLITGLSLGIIAELVISNKISNFGVLDVTKPEIYEPVLNELKKEGILFHDLK